MLFLIVGVILLGLYWAGVEPVAHWSWWAISAPFALTLLWWGLSDMLGLTQRRVMREMDERKAARRARNLDALGLGYLKGRTRRPPAPHQPRAVDPVSSARSGEQTRHDSKL